MQEGTNIFNCITCHKTFAENQSFMYHMTSSPRATYWTSIHEVNEPCDYVFGKQGQNISKWSNLNLWLQLLSKGKLVISLHEGIKPFKCNICDAGFTQKGQIPIWRKHIRILNRRLNQQKEGSHSNVKFVAEDLAKRVTWVNILHQ